MEVNRRSTQRMKQVETKSNKTDKEEEKMRGREEGDMKDRGRERERRDCGKRTDRGKV